MNLLYVCIMKMSIELFCKKCSLMILLQRLFMVREAVKKPGYFMTLSRFHFPLTHPTL